MKKYYPENIKSVLAAALIVLLTLVVYSRVAGYGFVNFDDDGYVYDNPYVLSGISAKGLVYAFTTTDKGNWIPLTWLSYMGGVQLFGTNPSAQHLVNLFFHILNALLLFFLLKKTTKELWPSAIAALLFAIHPLHVESVAWISERKDVLSAFFCLLSLVAYCGYVRDHKLKSYLLTMGFFMAALMSKAMAVTLPIVFILMDFWPLKRVEQSFPGNGGKQKYWLIEKIPFFLVSFAVGLITIWSQKSVGAMAVSSSFPLSARLSNALMSYAGYLYKTVWPVDLAVFYPYPAKFSLAMVSINAFVLLTISCFALMYIKRLPFFAVGWLWFLITLFPVIGLIQVGTQAMADRYTYIPLIGPFFAVAFGIYQLSTKFRLERKIMVVLILALCLITWNQVKTWKNSTTLFGHALSVTENNWMAHLNLGEAMFEQGCVNAAIFQYQRALQINPGLEIAYMNLGVAFAKKGEIDESIDYYHQALKIRNNLPVAWVNLGNAWFRKGRYDKALARYYRALELKPDDAGAYSGIGAVMVRKGYLTKAVSAFQRALAINPYLTSARNNLHKVQKAMEIQ